ncbi:membrane integrity-associated transporter subunit PqiC [Cellvibrio sp. KY-YJ-3]|uniref:PqiC family protein n=1 Tax=Cellvibrio sp. KY-YJ-3 TaxID=454662 RepID=UPI00178240B5|nr:PqiC family protein [Cellvibrio sp. KY-YJ-3]
MMRHLFIIALLSSLLLGCQQSPRKQYYLLNATPHADQSVAVTQSVGLGPIEVADYLQRSQLIVNSDANSLQVSDNAYWGEPLPKGITRVLAMNLMNHQPTRAVELFPWRSDSTPAISIRIQIHDLQIIDGYAVINASWKLMDNLAKKTVAQHHHINKRPCESTARDIAAAYSILLAELGNEINQALVSKGK